jgi:hypothetical protein
MGVVRARLPRRDEHRCPLVGTGGLIALAALAGSPGRGADVTSVKLEMMAEEEPSLQPLADRPVLNQAAAVH